MQRFILKSSEVSPETKAEVKEALLDTIFSESLSGHYTAICSEMAWPVDEAKLKDMKEKTSKYLSDLEEKINDAVENLGDSEVRDALTAKAEYLCKIGEPKEKRMLAFKVSGTRKDILNQTTQFPPLPCPVSIPRAPCSSSLFLLLLHHQVKYQMPSSSSPFPPNVRFTFILSFMFSRFVLFTFISRLLRRRLLLSATSLTWCFLS